MALVGLVRSEKPRFRYLPILLIVSGSRGASRLVKPAPKMEALS